MKFVIHLLELKIAYVRKMKPMDLVLDVSIIYKEIISVFFSPDSLHTCPLHSFVKYILPLIDIDLMNNNPDQDNRLDHLNDIQYFLYNIQVEIILTIIIIQSIVTIIFYCKLTFWSKPIWMTLTFIHSTFSMSIAIIWTSI